MRGAALTAADSMSQTLAGKAAQAEVARQQLLGGRHGPQGMLTSLHAVLLREAALPAPAGLFVLQPSHLFVSSSQACVLGRCSGRHGWAAAALRLRVERLLNGGPAPALQSSADNPHSSKRLAVSSETSNISPQSCLHPV